MIVLAWLNYLCFNTRKQNKKNSKLYIIVSILALDITIRTWQAHSGIGRHMYLSRTPLFNLAFGDHERVVLDGRTRRAFFFERIHLDTNFLKYILKCQYRKSPEVTFL